MKLGCRAVCFAVVSCTAATMTANRGAGRNGRCGSASVAPTRRADGCKDRPSAFTNGTRIPSLAKLSKKIEQWETERAQPDPVSADCLGVYLGFSVCVSTKARTVQFA